MYIETVDRPNYSPLGYNYFVGDLCMLSGVARRAPQRAWIDAIWLELGHCVLEPAHIRRCCVQAIEIAKVSTFMGKF